MPKEKAPALRGPCRTGGGRSLDRTRIGPARSQNLRFPLCLLVSPKLSEPNMCSKQQATKKGARARALTRVRAKRESGWEFASPPRHVQMPCLTQQKIESCCAPNACERVRLKARCRSNDAYPHAGGFQAVWGDLILGAWVWGRSVVFRSTGSIEWRCRGVHAWLIP